MKIRERRFVHCGHTGKRGKERGPVTLTSVFRVQKRELGLSEEQPWSHPLPSLPQPSAVWSDELSELCERSSWETCTPSGWYQVQHEAPGEF